MSCFSSLPSHFISMLLLMFSVVSCQLIALGLGNQVNHSVWNSTTGYLHHTGIPACSVIHSSPQISVITMKNRSTLLWHTKIRSVHHRVIHQCLNLGQFIMFDLFQISFCVYTRFIDNWVLKLITKTPYNSVSLPRSIRCLHTTAIYQLCSQGVEASSYGKCI